MINHGKRGGYYAHKKLNQEPCDECREAINEYMRDYRSRRNRNRFKEKARREALSRLRENHRPEYDQLYLDIMMERGTYVRED